MNFKAKFQVTEVCKTVHGDKIKLGPAYGDSAENRSFSKFTPSGSIELMITNESIVGQIAPGEQFYIDFVKA